MEKKEKGAVEDFGFPSFLKMDSLFSSA